MNKVCRVKLETKESLGVTVKMVQMDLMVQMVQMVRMEPKDHKERQVIQDQPVMLELRVLMGTLEEMDSPEVLEVLGHPEMMRSKDLEESLESQVMMV